MNPGHAPHGALRSIVIRHTYCAGPLGFHLTKVNTEMPQTCNMKKSSSDVRKQVAQIAVGKGAMQVSFTPDGRLSSIDDALSYRHSTPPR